jgi:hypothetical protein
MTTTQQPTQSLPALTSPHSLHRSSMVPNTPPSCVAQPAAAAVLVESAVQPTSAAPPPTQPQAAGHPKHTTPHTSSLRTLCDTRYGTRVMAPQALVWC